MNYTIFKYRGELLIMWDKQKLYQASTCDIRTIEPERVKDISEIKIDETRGVRERILDLLSQTENPYIFRCGDMLIKVKYTSEASLESKLVRLLIDHCE